MATAKTKATSKTKVAGKAKTKPKSYAKASARTRDREPTRARVAKAKSAAKRPVKALAPRSSGGSRIGSRLISSLLTPSPVTIGLRQPLAKAHELMREHNIRHLPVMHGGELVGMLSQRDLHMIETFKDVDPNVVPVEEALSREPFTVRHDATVAYTAKQMAAKKYGAAVVLDNAQQVVGVFTTIDALLALSEN